MVSPRPRAQASKWGLSPWRHAEPEPRGEKQVTEDQTRVGRENQVGQAGHGLDQLDRGAQLESVWRRLCHCLRASSESLPVWMFIQGLISYSIPK